MRRIIFLDLMRAFAVLMMMQGHTIDTLLADEYRIAGSVIYSIWHTMRGFTAPIFMFTSGVVFTYLLHYKNIPFGENPRVKKGLKRFLLLVTIGYLLRYPTWRVFDFRYVSDASWRIFFGVDALHLIGFGLLFIIILSWISNKLKINYFIIYVFGALFFTVLYPFVKDLEWANYLPLPIASYIYQGTGSLFPFFPWAAYVIAGAVMGEYLARKPKIYLRKSFTYRLLLIGFLFAVIAQSIHFLAGVSSNYTIVFYRTGIVLILNGTMSYLAQRVSRIPDIIEQIGTHTLLIYVVHLVILYGSAWSIGLTNYYGHSFSLGASIFSALIMISAMTVMVLILIKIDFKKMRLNIRNNLLKLVAAKKI